MSVNKYDTIYAILHEGTNKRLAKKYILKKSCPPSLLTLFASDDYAVNIWGKKIGLEFKSMARSNPSLPREEIEKFLALGLNNPRAIESIKAAICNVAVTGDDIRTLVKAVVGKQDMIHVLRVCASHRNLPIELHEVVAKHELHQIRVGAARNRNISKELLTNLLYDKEYKVQILAVKNRTTPQEEIVKFLHTIEEVAETLPHYLLIRTIMLRLPDGADLQKALCLLNIHLNDQRANALAVASYSTDPLILKEKVQDGDPEVRAHAIFNPATREEDRVVGSLLDTPIKLNSQGTVIKPRKQWMTRIV